jgi:hypothetical protein
MFANQQQETSCAGGQMRQQHNGCYRNPTIPYWK